MWWEKGKVPLGLEGPSRKGDREARGCSRALPLRLGLPALGERCSQAEASARVERVQQGCAADPRPCHGVLCPVPGQGLRPGARPPASERHKSALSAGAAPAGGR